MFGAISEGTTEVTNFLQGADCLSTISCFRSMGIEIENTPERILIHEKVCTGFRLRPPFSTAETAEQRHA